MAAPTPHNVEFEAAKFLQKLIHESTDEPAKLATKLYVILQHMKASGKENSMPYQVISRAMETVINQHGLDIEALMSSRLPLSTSSRAQAAGCSQTAAPTENDTIRTDGLGSNKPPGAPTVVGHDTFQGPMPQRSGRSFDHESPSSMDTRSTNSHSQDRRDTASWEQQGTLKDPSRASIKRKRSDSSAMEPPDDSMQQTASHSGMFDTRKEKIAAGKTDVPGNYPGGSEGWKQGFKGAANFRETAVPGHIFSPKEGDVSMANLNSVARLNAPGMQTNLDRLQIANPSQTSEVGPPRGSAPRDTGKGLAVPTIVSNLPFKEHQLKQLRAQCLVYLAFRNGLSPKRIHLEIALGNIFTREGTSGTIDGSHGELTSDKVKQPTLESSSTSEVGLAHGNLDNVKFERSPMGTVAAGCVPETDVMRKDAENTKIVEGKRGMLADPSLNDAANQVSPGGGILESEQHNQEMTNTSAVSTTALQPDISGVRSPAVRVHVDNLLADGATRAAYVMGMNNQLKPEMMRWSGVAHNELSPVALPSSLQHDAGNRKDGSSSLSQRDGIVANLPHADIHLSTSLKAKLENDANLLKVAPQGADDNSALDVQTKSATDTSNMVPVFDSSYSMSKDQSLALMDNISEPEEEDKLVSAGLASSLKYSLSEKWIMAHQKRKVVNDQKWEQKLQKADLRITACFSELKETVRSSEDISAKTRSVIELKKLQLLELQRCLRRNIVNDFFKPIQTEMDRLKSIKKHRIGRRMKHVEKYEQKMKEERQKRIRERQKEFFSEVEVHKERLEDVFKFKRERCKGFNRYVKEFHKRKERIHREKIDRIQREKINLLKINDVEGYLRMVQDAKSDRVKQLLKETEKYLQKLGSKLQQAKSSARQVEMDENRTGTADESSEFIIETEDEKDQAKHYKESNEKYYLIAHSIKENITEQPVGLQGGKLREYQMNGLRWLVSLYNNHLNGILADEMGLGKTVQVISLLCYLMEAKNDRGPFLVVVPSSVLPGWVQEMSFWAPGINKIVYAGPPEERRKLFKENIVHQKFNVLLTTYEYLMNKHDRPKLSKIHWHYVIIDEGHRIKNASCKLNADLKHYHSSHRLLLTGTPLQNSLEELWALLNFLLPNIFNSSEDFSQWFNKPFESNGDNSPDEALLSEEENLLIINRLHQVLRPFVLRRLKHKVENELPEKIERLVRCEASAYQKLLMKRVEENLGSLGVSKGRAVHNSVMELRNICNHPYLSQLHSDEVDTYMPKHFLPPIVRLCGKLEMLDRLLPKLKATNHRVLFFSTMTRLLDIMEEYLVWKQYRYLRLDGHTSGQDRGGLIDKFNQPDSPFFIFLLSIRAGGVGVNLQAADTVIIFDTDWNPQVDLQAQARAHRIGQKKDVLVLRLETVKSVEEQVRAAAEHKLGVANQSITAGFFDNNTSAEDRREYLESLLRECKKEEATPVLDDDSLNDILARSESEIDVFEAVDQKRREEEMATWKTVALDHVDEGSEAMPTLPSRLVTDDDLKTFYEAMRVLETPIDEPASSFGVKRKSGSLGGFDTRQYGRGKRAREVRSYEEQWTEEEFEKICQAETPDTPRLKDEKIEGSKPLEISQTVVKAEVPLQSLQTPPAGKIELSLQSMQTPPVEKADVPLQTLQTPPPHLDSSSLLKKEVFPPVKRGRGRPKRTPADVSASLGAVSTAVGVSKPESQPLKETVSGIADQSRVSFQATSAVSNDPIVSSHQAGDVISPSPMAVPCLSPSVDAGAPSSSPISGQPKRQGRKVQPREKSISGQSASETAKRRGRKITQPLPPAPAPAGTSVPESKPYNELKESSSDTSISTNLTPKGTLDTSRADGIVRVPLTGVLAVEGLATSKPAGSHVSCDVVLKTEVPVADKKASGIEQSHKKAMLNSEAVGSDVAEPADLSKANLVPQDIPLSRSIDSSALPVGGSSPFSKVGADIQIVGQQSAISSSESPQTGSTGLRPGRRQNQKPQNTAEPVRRRGRKRGQSDPNVCAPAQPVQDQISEKLLKSTGSVAPSTVNYISPPGGVTKFEMGSNAATVPIIPSGLVSRIMPSTTVMDGVSSSMNFINKGSVANNLSTVLPNPCPSATPDTLSGTPKMPVPLQGQGLDQRPQGGETVPRRRGRKKGTPSPTSADHSVAQSGDIIDRRVIATRSRQMNTNQSKSSHGIEHLGGVSASLTSNEAKARGTPTLPNQVFANPGIEKFTPVKEPRLGGAVEEIKLFHKPADFPPISCKGKTNVIVLALESTAGALDLIGTDGVIHEKVKCAEPHDKFVSSAPLLEPEVSGLNLSSSAGGVTTKLDEELSAPPGFEMTRPCVFNSPDVGVKRLQECDGGEMSPSLDAKRGSLVLALESASHIIDPGTEIQKMSEMEESRDVLRIRTFGQGSNVPLNSESCRQGFMSAADVSMTSQSEDDMAAPPGFDKPLQCLPASAAAKIFECHDQASESSAEHGSADPLIASPVLGCQTGAALTKDSGEKEQSQSTADPLIGSPVLGCQTNAASTLDSGEKEQSHGTADPLITSPALGCQIGAASSLDLGEKEKSQGFGDGEAEMAASTASCANHCDIEGASMTELKVKRSCEGFEKGEAAAASCVNRCETKEGSIPEFKEKDTCHASTLESKEANNSNTEGDDTMITAAVCFDTTTDLFGGLKEEVESHGTDDGNAEPGALDASQASRLGSDNEAASTLHSEEQEESQGLDIGAAENDDGRAPTTTTVVASAIGSALFEKPEEEREYHGPDVCNSTCDIAAPMSSDMIMFGATTADLEPNEISQGGQNDAVGAPIASNAGECVTTPASALKLFGEGELQDFVGPDDCKAERDGAGVFHKISHVVGSDDVAVSSLESLQKEDCPGGQTDVVCAPIESNAEECISQTASGPDDCKTEHDDGDAHAISDIISSDGVAVSSLESIHKENFPGSDSRAPEESHAGSDLAVVSGSESKAPEDSHAAAVSAPESKAPEESHAGSDPAAVSALESKAPEESHAGSDPAAISAPESKAPEESHAGSDPAAVSAPESKAPEESHAGSDPAAVSASESKASEESHEGSESKAPEESHAGSDPSTVSASESKAPDESHAGSDPAAVSAPKSTAPEESHGSDGVYTKHDGIDFSNVEHDGVDALLTSSPLAPDNMAAPCLQTIENEMCSGVRAPITSGATFFHTTGASSLQTKENDERSGVDLNITSSTAVSDTKADIPLQTNESDERSCLDASMTSSTAVFDTLAASPTNENDDRSGVDAHAPITSSTAVFDAMDISPLQTKHSDERSGVDAPATHSTAVVSDTVADSPLHAKENDERSGVESVNVLSISSIGVSSTMSSPLQLRENEEYGSAEASLMSSSTVSDAIVASPLKTRENGESEGVDAPSASISAVSDTIADSPLQMKENEECRGVDSPSASINAVSDTIDDLPLQTKENEESSGVDSPNASINAVSDTIAASPLQTKENEEPSGVDALSASSNAVSDTIADFPLQTKENEEHNGANAPNASINAVSDTKAASPLVTEENEELSGVDALSGSINAVSDTTAGGPLESRE